MTRPDAIFCAVWLVVLAIYIPVPSVVTPPLPMNLILLLAFNLLTAPIIYQLVRHRIETRLGRRSDIHGVILTPPDRVAITRFLRLSMAMWIVIMVMNIVTSGGLPIIWYLTGDSREYADYGIPTVAGLGDMFRCFAGVLCVLLYLVTHKKRYAWLWLFNFVPCVLTVSRGGVAVYILQSVGAFLLMHRIKPRQVFLAGAAFAAAASLFVVLGSLRGIQMKASDYAGVGDYFGGLPVGLYWAWAYIATPLGNVAYAVSLNVPHDYVPQYTLVYLLPSFVRMALFKGQIYTPLNVIELNATSIYSPLYMDFGVLGAAVGITIFLALASYVHILARRGNLFYIVLYPALYAALGLSFFHIFALTPGVIAVPFLCVWFAKFVSKHHPAHPGKAQAGPVLASSNLSPMSS
jgi:oligosaccharide repeat unit polymerase